MQASRVDYIAYNSRVPELAMQCALPLVDLAAGAVDGAFEPDGFHLTAAGQAWVADRVYDILKRASIWEALTRGDDGQ